MRCESVKRDSQTVSQPEGRGQLCRIRLHPAGRAQGCGRIVKGGDHFTVRLGEDLAAKRGAGRIQAREQSLHMTIQLGTAHLHGSGSRKRQGCQQSHGAGHARGSQRNRHMMLADIRLRAGTGIRVGTGQVLLGDDKVRSGSGSLGGFAVRGGCLQRGTTDHSQLGRSGGRHRPEMSERDSGITQSRFESGHLAANGSTTVRIRPDIRPPCPPPGRCALDTDTV